MFKEKPEEDETQEGIEKAPGGPSLGTFNGSVIGANLENLRIIPGNRGIVRQIECVWLLMTRKGRLCGGAQHFPRSEAYFTVGARVGHTTLICEST
jgi:hypothetical protein